MRSGVAVGRAAGCIAVLLAVSAVARETPASQEVEALVRSGGDSAALSRNPSSGAFVLRNLSVETHGADARSRCAAFLSANLGAWVRSAAGVAADVSREEKSDNGTTVHFSLSVDGVPVHNGRIRVFEGSSGRIERVQSDLPWDMPVLGTFEISEERAGRIAREVAAAHPGARGPVALRSVRKVYHASRAGLVPAYRCAILTADLVSSYSLVVHAASGEMLARMPLARTEGGTP
jgi:Zn-dependent metalloprotease